MEKNYWIQDPKTQNTKRFHRDKKSQLRYPKVFIDSGRPLSNKPAFLKSRAYVSFYKAQEEWLKLRENGWRIVPPQWGLDLDV